jgi:D-glycero-D-manno-heptose 1,7-bisphosphate phosphatase
MRHPALFVDRDGTLMRDAHYCSDPKDVHVFPGVPEALRRARAAGYRVVVITNQGGIGRGQYTLEDYHRVHAELVRQLGGESMLDGTYFCDVSPPIESHRRKPAPGMLLEAAEDLMLDTARSWMIGDKEIDVMAGHAAGARAILVRTGYGRNNEAGTKADHVADDLPGAVDYILSQGGLPS